MSGPDAIRLTDAQVEEAKRQSIAGVVGRLPLDHLSRSRRELVGPCPRCGGDDRFVVDLRKGGTGAWVCRRCPAGGTDAIGLVQHVLGLDFKAAVVWLVGEAVAEIPPEERRRREEEAARRRAAAEAREAREREKAIRRAKEIWAEGKPAAGSPVAEYLALRGLPPSVTREPPPCLRFHPDLPYVVEEGGRRAETIHRGPAMLAAIQFPRGGLIGVHRTWFDLSRPGGKIDLGLDAKGRARPRKKVWGSKRRGAIRLNHHRFEGFSTLVMGEGIETTLTAMAADAIPGAAYWAGIDLGHMAGRRMIRGEGGRFRGIPDLDDPEAFLPPPWVRSLVFIQDGDSEPRDTRAKLLAGLRRARARIPGLRAFIVHAGEGRDLNDVLMRGGT